MPCDRHVIYDKVNAILGGLCDKYSPHKAIIGLNAVVEVKLNGVKVHVQVHDKKKNALPIDAKLRIRNLNELHNAQKFFENCDTALGILLVHHKNDLPECNECYVIDN